MHSQRIRMHIRECDFFILKDMKGSEARIKESKKTRQGGKEVTFEVSISREKNNYTLTFFFNYSHK